VTGEEWLANVFEPGLREERIRGSNVVYEWAGALRALEACGLLRADQVKEAKRRLHAANEAQRSAAADVARPRSLAAPPSNFLRAVLAPNEPLADVGEMTLVLSSIELWTRSVFVRMAGLDNGVSDQLDEEFRGALERWANDARVRGEAANDPPGEPGARRLLDVKIALSDDLGTDYRWKGAAAGGTGTEWHTHRIFEPGVPGEASGLMLEVIDPEGLSVRRLDLDLGQ
jgi:hypothetical protein